MTLIPSRPQKNDPLIPQPSDDSSEYTGETFVGLNHLLNLEGFIQTIDFAPTAKPKKFSDQFRIVTNGGSSRAYIYDTVGLAWKYVALT